eukprot:scaffold35967_cov52-Attheya_sp.AAC.1
MSSLDQHGRKLAAILRYLGSVHGGGSDEECPFVREQTTAAEEEEEHQNQVLTGENDGTQILLTLADIYEMDRLCKSSHPNHAHNSSSSSSHYTIPLPYTFYAPSTTAAATMMNASTSSTTTTHNNNSIPPPTCSSSCWFRVKRLTKSSVIRPTLSPRQEVLAQKWARHLKVPDLWNLAELHPPDATTAATAAARRDPDIRSLLRMHKTYQRRLVLHSKIEALYSTLFELVGSSSTFGSSSSAHRNVLWGFGHVYWNPASSSSSSSENLCDNDDELIVDGNNNDNEERRRRVDKRTSLSRDVVMDGPLFEVRVELELCTDGSIVVRPCEHTGLSFHPQVMAALLTASRTTTPSHSLSWHQTLADMDPTFLSPGQPHIYYTKLLKQMAVQLAPGGQYMAHDKWVTSSRLSSRRPNHNLIITNGWSLYHRAKPSSVWARDAMTLMDQVLTPHNPNHTHDATATSTVLPMTIPKASIALTYGSGALQNLIHQEKLMQAQRARSGFWQTLSSWFPGPTKNQSDDTLSSIRQRRNHLFPLPSSDAQNQIAELLLRDQAPAVVVVGPPGTGKSHSIANIVCAYLAQGRRVLVTSKGAPALSVLRHRLPPCIQQLCVDVSMSESEGKQQLQQTVERLADTIASASQHTNQTNIDGEAIPSKCTLLEERIEALEQSIRDIDATLETQGQRACDTMQHPEIAQLACDTLVLEQTAPWLVSTMTEWTVPQVTSLAQQVGSLSEMDERLVNAVSGYGHRDAVECSPSDELISWVAAKAGQTSARISHVLNRLVSSVPIVGSNFGATEAAQKLEESVHSIRVYGDIPRSSADWQLVHRVLVRNKAIHDLYTSTLSLLVSRSGWPMDEIIQGIGTFHVNFPKSFAELLSKAAKVKQASTTWSYLHIESDSKQLEIQRRNHAHQLQTLYEKLVEAKVIAQLNESFSPEAQTALIRFAQLAGKSRLNTSQQASKMSQRQQRHRQQYLKSFEECVRYIPCWILTSSQVSDYLPPEIGGFDLVVIDEASQSDITALPCMLRGKQWLVVGDGKQVSPTESFVSESRVESLLVSLPDSPFKESFLPGQSFFDLCSQAFPFSRVVLTEHFRCAPEIIHFSNNQYYRGKLNALRMPTSQERMDPSIADVFVENGEKRGKTNERECDAIVSMVCDLVKSADSSIGVISLMGEEQSRLIRNRLLDSVGPQAFKRHSILVGDPPSFQGAERDVVFLSMVCSPGSSPTQSQLMHEQRMNVALSRAKNKVVLVHSITVAHVPSFQDVKVSVLQFFAKFGAHFSWDGQKINAIRPQQILTCKGKNSNTNESMRSSVAMAIAQRLSKEGFSIRDINLVWDGAFCIEDEQSGDRLAIAVEGSGERRHDWGSM